MTKPYYTLAIRDADGKWSAQFGDYIKEIVQEEAELEWVESQGYARSACKILTTQDNQAAINQGVAILNKWEKHQVRKADILKRSKP